MSRAQIVGANLRESSSVLPGMIGRESDHRFHDDGALGLIVTPASARCRTAPLVVSIVVGRM